MYLCNNRVYSIIYCTYFGCHCLLRDIGREGQRETFFGIDLAGKEYSLDTSERSLLAGEAVLLWLDSEK